MIKFDIDIPFELKLKLQNLKTKELDPLMEGGLKKAGEVLRDAAKAKVPADTGLLRESISFKSFRGKDGKLVAGLYISQDLRRHKKIKGKGKKGKRGQNVWAYYWRFVEYGTKKMSAQPFLRPTMDNYSKAAQDAMAAYIWSKIKGK